MYFIDGTSLAPRQVIPNPRTKPGAFATIPNPKYMLWCQKDQMILNILIFTLTKQYVTHVVGCAIALDLWKTLVTMLASQANAQVMQIHYQLATTKKGNSSITEYFQTFKTQSDTLYSDPNYQLGISSLVGGVKLGFGSLRTQEGQFGL